ADILESIVGAFSSEEGPPEPACVRRDDGSLLVSGWMPLDEFADLLAIEVPPHRGYHTVAGLVLQHFGSVPEVGQSFELDGWRFEIVDLDGRRIDKILATKLAADGGEPNVG
ncbi:MAG: transporter associated domain-containing protein, partial [Bradyrhizobium sp.]